MSAFHSEKNKFQIERLAFFSDAVFAIALTILVLELKAPLPDNIHNSNELWQWLLHLLPSIFAFILSFTIISISWVNHHSTMKLIHKCTAHFMYSNVFLLLTIVIIPFPNILKLVILISALNF